MGRITSGVGQGELAHELVLVPAGVVVHQEMRDASRLRVESPDLRMMLQGVTSERAGRFVSTYGLRAMKKTEEADDEAKRIERSS